MRGKSRDSVSLSPSGQPSPPDSRLESLEDPPAILRDARCIGGLSDETLEDPETLREAFIEWGTDLEDLTAKLSAGEYEDRNRFRSSVMRSAHGLAGSLVHLFDALEIDVVRELRVPAGLDTNSLKELTTSISISTAIQSKYGAFACYRQLFEAREEKRQRALSPTVDADDPLGTLIGSLVVRGEDVHRQVHEPAFARLGVRQTHRPHRGQGPRSRYPGRVRESALHVPDVPRLRTYRTPRVAS